MPPVGNKSKGKVKENRQSRSRNTTPSSVLSASGSTSAAAATTAYLEIPTASLMIPSNLQYDDLLEQLAGIGGIPDPKNLETLANDLRTLSDLAATRETACEGAVRNIVLRRKMKLEEEMELSSREVEEKAGLKRSAEDDDAEKSAKAGKLKKRKEQAKPREERPLTHGAHGVARQDGGRETTPKGLLSRLHTVESPHTTHLLCIHHITIRLRLTPNSSVCISWQGTIFRSFRQLVVAFPSVTDPVPDRHQPEADGSGSRISSTLIKLR